METNKIYALVVHDDDYKHYLFSTVRPHMNWKPKKKRWYESQETFDTRLQVWNEKFSPMVTKCLDFYKDLYPDFYEDFTFVSFGFGPGHEKTFWIYIKKNESEVTDV